MRNPNFANLTPRKVAAKPEGYNFQGPGEGGKNIKKEDYQPKKNGGSVLRPPTKKYAGGGTVSNGVAGREMGGGEAGGEGGADISGIINTGAPMVMGLTNSIINRTSGNDVKVMNAAANAGMQDPNKNLLKNQYSNVYNNTYKQQRGIYGTYKAGGLIKHVKGYDEGGAIKAVGAAAPLVGDLSSTIIDSQAKDEYGRYDTGSKGGDYAAGISSNALQGAGKGAAAGAALGPQGMAVGAGLGLLVGGIEGGMQAKASRESIQQQKLAEEQAKQQAERDRNAVKRDASLNQQLSDRKTGYGYAGGGLVKHLATGGLTPGMNDTQSNTPIVKNGYGTFNEAQTDQSPMYYQTRTNYNQPMSQWQDRPKYEEKGLGLGGGGGGLSFKPSFSQGGKIVGKGTGTSDSIKASVKGNSFVVPKKNAEVAEEIREKILLTPPKKKADLNQGGGEKVKLSNGEHLFTENEVAEIAEEGIDLNALAPDAKDKLRNHLNCGGKVKGYKKGGFLQPQLENEGLSQTATPMKKGGKVSLKPSPRIPTDAEMEMLAPVDQMTPAQKLQAEKEAKDAALLNKSAMAYEKSNPYKAPSKKKGIDGYQLADALSAAGNIVNGFQMNRFPNQQISLGKNFLASAGARPVDQISPEFQSVLNRANQDAKYGFSPQEQASLDQQRIEALNSQRLAARLGGLGYVGERDAINNSFGRGLQSAIANKDRMTQKQALANNLAMTKANMSRRLFDDKMNAWQQSQQSAGDLISTGLKNKMDNQRYNSVLTQLQLNRAKENGLFNNLNFGE